MQLFCWYNIRINFAVAKNVFEFDSVLWISSNHLSELIWFSDVLKLCVVSISALVLEKNMPWLFLNSFMIDLIINL